MQKDEDLNIISQVLSGNTAVFATLVDKYKHTACNVAYQITGNREDAEEVAMDAFVKAFRSLQSFKGDARFSTWLYRIVYNTAISRTRKKKYEYTQINESITENYSDTEFEESIYHISTDEQQALVTKAMSKLDPEDALIINLYYLNELSTEEISQITSLSVSNVKVKLHRIRKRIYAEVQKYTKMEIKELI
jgi:RNA polymerase sigma-70 factor (ECF subfamily)